MTDIDINTINTQIANLDAKVERINDIRVEMATVSAGIIQLNKSYDILVAAIQGQNGNPGLIAQAIGLQNDITNLRQDHNDLQKKFDDDFENRAEEKKEREQEKKERRKEVRGFWLGLAGSMILVVVDIVLHLLKVV